MKQTLQSFFILLSIFTLVSVALLDAAHAGRYELIKGKGVEVCEAYEKNLNSFNPSTPHAMRATCQSAVKTFCETHMGKAHL